MKRNDPTERPRQAGQSSEVPSRQVGAPVRKQNQAPGPAAGRQTHQQHRDSVGTVEDTAADLKEVEEEKEDEKRTDDR